VARRVAIVTGGSGALGQAIALRLLAEGLAVAVPWVVEAERDALVARAGGAARERLLEARCDVTDGAAIEAHVAEVRRRFDRLDVLVTAVGGFAGGALVETDRATWEGMLALNLTSAYTAARAVVPHMVAARGGRVVAIASRAVLPPAGGFIAYTAAKAGVIAFAQALAQEVRSHGITVNAIAPSTMDTPANRAAMPGVDPATWVPVEAVADAVAWLASESAGHVTGTVLAI